MASDEVTGPCGFQSGENEMKKEKFVVVDPTGYFYTGTPDSPIMSFAPARKLATVLTKSDAETVVSQLGPEYAIEAA